METTQIVWYQRSDNGKIFPALLKQRAYFRGSDIASWIEYPNIRDVSMNCAKLGFNSDNEYGNTGYSLRSYLIKQGFITPAK